MRPPATWREFEAAVPSLAAAGRRLLEDAPGVPGVAFLATTAADALPRIHPVVPAIVDAHLWVFLIESPKQRDVDRTGRYAIHSVLGQDDESFTCAGDAVRVASSIDRDRVAASMPYDDIDERHLLYELRLRRALWTTWASPTSPAHARWTLPTR